MRVLLWAAGFALGAAGLGLAFGRLEPPGQAPISVDLDAMWELEARLAELARRPRGPRQWRIAFLGDSTSMHFAERSHGIDMRLEGALARSAARGARPRVFSLSFLGAMPQNYYFLSHRIAAAGPDAVILVLNLQAFSEQLRGNVRPQLAGWIPLRRLGEALLLPLDRVGLDASELLLYTSVVRAGGLGAWLQLERLQARATARWRAAESALVADTSGGPTYDTRTRHYFATRNAWFRGSRPERETAELVALRLGPALAGLEPDHPALTLLAATLDVFAERRIETLAYVAPVNVEHHEALGAYSRESLRPTLETLRRVVEGHGASFLDLSTLLPDAAFIDGSGHLAVGDPVDAPPLVIEPLVRALRENGHRGPR